VPADSVVVMLRLVGGRAFTSGLAASAVGLEAFETKAEGASRQGDALNRSSGRLKGAMGAIGSVAMGVGAAAGAAGVAATAMGLKFNASMEQSRVAFTNLLGSGERAEAMLDRLYNLAKQTPFEFPQLTQASQKLLGFGMAAKDVIPSMRTIGDAIAGVGGGAAEIDSVTRAIGQMQAKGKVSSEELLQLAEAGVPAYKLLADQLGITGAQLDKQLRAGAISADKGIGALMEGMRSKYGGMAKAQSKTFSGMLSSMKDSAMQILGEITMPLFTGLRDDVMPALNKLLSSGKLQQLAKQGMAAIGDAFRAVVPYVRDLIEALKPLAPFIENILWPLLKGFGIGVLGGLAASLKILIPIIRILASVLGWIGEKARPLRGVFQSIGQVMGFVFGGPVVLKIIGYLRVLVGRRSAQGAADPIPPVRRVGQARHARHTRARACAAALRGLRREVRREGRHRLYQHLAHARRQARVGVALSLRQGAECGAQRDLEVRRVRAQDRHGDCRRDQVGRRRCARCDQGTTARRAGIEGRLGAQVLAARRRRAHAAVGRRRRKRTGAARTAGWHEDHAAASEPAVSARACRRSRRAHDQRAGLSRSPPDRARRR
jgi:tape measure domain-containing protein